MSRPPCVRSRHRPDERDLVQVAPAPVLAQLGRAHNRAAIRTCAPGRVTIGRQRRESLDRDPIELSTHRRHRLASGRPIGASGEPRTGRTQRFPANSSPTILTATSPDRPPDITNTQRNSPASSSSRARSQQVQRLPLDDRRDAVPDPCSNRLASERMCCFDRVSRTNIGRDHHGDLLAAADLEQFALAGLADVGALARLRS